ncbi:MAG TPA: aldolase/citrate lyase family protein [Bryobacterales bacterium]|nr:aldolase/citrate lyase family protein [Bryobacterales bacterium]
MLKRNSLRQKIAANRALIGTFLEIPAPAIVEICGLAGFDFLIVDEEHGPFSRESTGEMIRAAGGTSVSPVVRVRENTPAAIQAALDLGAVAVQIANVSCREEAERACEAARFYPRGKRGLNPYVRAASHFAEETAEYLKSANEDIVVIVQIEGADAVRNLDSILSVDGLDMVFLGPYDLSQSLGIPGQLDHPLLAQNMRQVADMAAKAGVVVGTFADSADRAAAWIRAGVRYVAVSTDSGIFLSACCRLKNALAV